ncbi:MAG: CHASE domain-containing protein [Pseudomonadota bacterium]|nr:CHASE domain-containing protein [Pseudomonadota bacterium]
MKTAKLADSPTFPAHTATTGARLRAWGFALLAALLVLATEQFIEHFARQRALEVEKNGVLSELSTLRARLEGVVNANLFLVHGLAAVIAARPDMDQAGFNAIARNLVDERHALRNLAAAPDLVISMMYPLAGNEAAVGLDYRSHPEQKQAALRARDSGQSVLAGPLRLQQGGIGIIAREPVFLAPDRPGGERRFWGLVSAVIDAETLYRIAGLRDRAPGLQLAVRGRDGSGPRGPVFFGDAGVFTRQPVTLEVTLPGGSWQIAAMPAAGWGRPGAGVNLIRLLGLLAALAAALMAYRLARDHQALRETVVRWRESQELFERFMANLPAGAYVRDTSDGHMLFQNRWLCDNLPGSLSDFGSVGYKATAAVHFSPASCPIVRL